VRLTEEKGNTSILARDSDTGKNLHAAFKKDYTDKNVCATIKQYERQIDRLVCAL
jgi:hypothetical protein